MTPYQRMFLCAVVIVLMLTAGCTLLNPPKTGANPLVADTPAPASSAAAPAATSQPGAAGTQAPGTCTADVSADAANCGGCGLACPANALCQAGQCYCKDGYTADTSNQCVPAPAGTGTGNGCPAGMSPCPDGYCYELTSDAANCGMCGNMCPSGMICSASTCTSVPADATTTTTTTPTTSASPGGSGLSRVNPGTFKLSCVALGQTDCSGTCANLSTSNGNCGTCGHICSGLTATCCKGTCTSLKTDVSNCGTCGHKCNALSTCSGGSCVANVVTAFTVVPSIKIVPTVYQKIPNYIPLGP
jgi:hypothetical protein